MYCNNCGAELKDGEIFCRKCGTRLRNAEAEVETDVKAEVEADLETDAKHPIDKRIVIGAAVAAVVLALVIGFVTIKIINKDDTEQAADNQTINSDNEAVETEATAASANAELVEKIAALNNPDYQMATIDVYAENYSPAARDENATWDPTEFYALEGYGDEGGYINKNTCTLMRKTLKNAATGNLMQYEIYINPTTNQPNKIVSIETLEDGIEVVEYYFTNDSKINFIFIYTTDNYVSTYATPDKNGQRFLFSNDALTNWRFIQDGGIANICVGQNEADRLKDSYHSNQIFLYNDMSDEVKNQVDTYEKQMINAAYNTLNTVMNAESIAVIEGNALDANGNPLAGANVELYSNDFSEVLFTITTGDTGVYTILVPVADYSYNVRVSVSGCVQCNIYDIQINSTKIEVYLDNAYMIAESDADANVELTLGDAATYAEDGQSLLRIPNATVNVRAGINNRSGDYIYTFTADSNGYVVLTIKAGVYTIEVQADGYENMYYTIVSNPTVGTTSYSFYAAPKLAEGQVAVVLTWGATPADLDSHLFTSVGSGSQQVWYGNRADDYGTYLDVDDTSSYGPETITISQFNAASYYKYCVVDYTNSSAGNSYSTELSYSGANVSVYTSEGLVASYNMPKNVNALVWEVFEIRNGVVAPIQRYYNSNSTENNEWWDGNDDMSDAAQAYIDLINSKSEYEWGLSLYFMYWGEEENEDDYKDTLEYIGSDDVYFSLITIPNCDVPLMVASSTLCGWQDSVPSIYLYNKTTGNVELLPFLMGMRTDACIINYNGVYEICSVFENASCMDGSIYVITDNYDLVKIKEFEIDKNEDGSIDGFEVNNGNVSYEEISKIRDGDVEWIDYGSGGASASQMISILQSYL